LSFFSLCRRSRLLISPFNQFYWVPTLSPWIPLCHQTKALWFVISSFLVFACIFSRLEQNTGQGS
jgi:hypothetical protein